MTLLLFSLVTPYCRTSVDDSMVIFFFFQAEDGIRDLVRSRGLGDVYKRQMPGSRRPAPSARRWPSRVSPSTVATGTASISAGTVSYTHLTLPTSDLV